MLNKRSKSPSMLTFAELNIGHDAQITPAEQIRIERIILSVSFFLRKNTDRKLMNTGFVATGNAPIPAVTRCIAIT